SREQMIVVAHTQRAVRPLEPDIPRLELASVMVAEHRQQHHVLASLVLGGPVDVEVAGVAARGTVLEHVPPPRVLAHDRRMVRHDIEQLSEAVLGQRGAQPRVRSLAPELVVDPRRVGDVVAVLATGRGLHVWRTIEMTDAEVREIGRERRRVDEFEIGVELHPICRDGPHRRYAAPVLDARQAHGFASAGASRSREREFSISQSKPKPESPTGRSRDAAFVPSSLGNIALERKNGRERRCTILQSSCHDEARPRRAEKKVASREVSSRRRASRLPGYGGQKTCRLSHSAMSAGFSSPSISIVTPSFISTCPGLRSVTSSSSALARIRLPTRTGAGKRTLSKP